MISVLKCLYEAGLRVLSFRIKSERLYKLSQIFGLKRVGHTGTLDPMASGLLVVCFGKYTKLVNELNSLNKDSFTRLTSLFFVNLWVLLIL